MKTIETIEAKKLPVSKRKRVAAYARVSIESVRMQHSLSAQISHYSSLIQGRRDWIYAGVYADYAVSGTSTDGRAEFKRMLEDCENGKIDIILTKSIQRFARNTVDLLNTVRRLKELGIEVRFEKENINSLSGDGELMLTILASFAQEESRSLSENCKWGVRKRFQAGTMGMANKHILGYRYDDELKKYLIIPEEAVIVRRMFRLFLDGISLREICRDLNDAGYRTVNGCLFQEASLSKLIKNEIYAGDLLRQKSYIADPITKNKLRNQGELPRYLYTDAHEAIIDRQTYEKVKDEIQRRSALVNPTYPFSGNIHCTCCGNYFTRQKRFVNGTEYVLWICRSKKESGMTCSTRCYAESLLKRICAEMLHTNSFDPDQFRLQVREIRVLPNGDLEFHLFNGEVRLWKDLHLDCTRHTPTKTIVFRGKLHCEECGETYHCANNAGHWINWYCMGKRRKGYSCSSRNYPDHRLRSISAYVMGLDSFDDKLFDRQVEQVRILGDYKFEYVFKDGRRKLWEKA